MRQNKVNLTKLAKSLPWKTAKTIYRHFKNPDLGYDELLEYSRALKYDFKDEFPELVALRKLAREPYMHYKVDEIDDEGDLIEYYRGKYEELLEKYNHALERYNALLESKLPAEVRKA